MCVILAYVGVLFAVCAFATLITEGHMYGMFYVSMFFFTVCHPFLAVPTAIGVPSVMRALRAKKKTGTAPIETLQLGILGLSGVTVAFTLEVASICVGVLFSQ